MLDFTEVIEFDITGNMINPDGEIYDAPDIKFWHQNGATNGATHLIIMSDGDGSLPQPYYVKPDECWQDIQGQLEGGGHCWRVFDLTTPLSEKDVTDFCNIL